MDGMQFQLKEGTAKKLTNWSKEPDILALKQDFDTAKPAHDSHVTKIRHWNDLMNVKGQAKPASVKGRSSVQPKLIRRQAEWRYSALTEPFLSSQKLFKVSPSTYEDDKAARQNEMVLNWQFRTKIDRVRFIDNYVRCTVDEGTAVVRLGWKRTTVKVKQTVPVFNHFRVETQQQADALQQAIALKQENPRGFEEGVDPGLKECVALYEEMGEVTYAVQAGEMEVEVEKAIENHPTLDVLDMKNFYLDPTCGGDFSKARFAIYSFETDKAELLKEPKRYKNLDRVNWEAATPLVETDHATSTVNGENIKDPLRKKVVAYEYWGFYDVDGSGKLTSIVATWIGDTIIRMEANPFPDEKLPFVLVPYLPVKREVFGEPDAELLEDNQKILGAVTRGMIDLLGRSANSQQGFAKGMLDPLNRRRFDNGQDYEFNPSINPNGGHIEHKYPELPQSALVIAQMVNQDSEALTGVKSFSGGLSGETYGQVATAIRGVLDAASKREMAILRRLAKGMSEIGTKIIAMNAVFLSDKEVVRVTNEEFITVNREDLKGNFDLETDISTAEVDNAKAQDLGFMLQTIGPNTDPSIVLMILAEIADLKRMPVLAQKLRTFRPQPTPEQQMMQKLQLEEMQLKVEKLKSEIALNNAKAQEALANKDKTNLDFVEQETGTAHLRDMQKQGAQARGNMDLEITKALVNPTKVGEKKPDVKAAFGFNELSDLLRGENVGSNSPARGGGMQFPAPALVQ